MSEKEFLVDAVAQFLQSSEWQEALTSCLDAHWTLFIPDQDEDQQKKGVGYSMEQYDAFRQFKDLAERLLEGVIGELGCSATDLVEILEESARRGASGERRFLIKTLLTFEEYQDFHERITQYAREKANAMFAAPQERGLLDETEQSFLPWAETLMGMNSQQAADSSNARIAMDNEADTRQAKEDNPDGNRLQELEQNLIRERLKVDLLVAQRIAEANAQLKQQMLHLTPADLDETEMKSAEEGLDALFSKAWDETAQAFYYFHSVSGESVWEPPACGFYDANQEYQMPDQALSEADKSGVGVDATVDDGSELEMEKVLEKISREHDEERRRLELVLEVEKARQKEELRRRKEKRRRDRLAKKKKKENDQHDDTEAAEEKESVATNW
ncbi:hypothetical protein ATCC90586_006878 [Pythium insidiosum]|nr:hypothetical protein ATCC90586_006878 [Pythium insidiosum]